MSSRKIFQKRGQSTCSVSFPSPPCEIPVYGIFRSGRASSGNLETYRHGFPTRAFGYDSVLSWICVFIVFVFATVFLSGCTSSNQTETTPVYQCYYDYVNTRAALPDFDARLFWSPDSSGQRLDVYVSVRESRLRFDKDSNSFAASYTSSIHVSGKVPLSKDVDRRLVLGDFPKSDQNAYDAFITSFPVSGGEHTVQISVADNESKVRSARSYVINIPEIYNKPLLLSGVMFLARYDTSGQAKKITPFILSNVGLLSDTLRFFTVLSSKESSEDSLSFYVYKIQSREPVLPSFNIQMSVYQPLSYNPCENDIDTILVYKYSVASKFVTGNSFVFGNVPKPPPGNYLLKVVAKDDSNNSSMTYLTFTVRDRDFPKVSGNLRAMVSSLNYIAATNEVKKIIEARTDSAVKANLIDFWKEHGGLAKMAQYYQRVSQANQSFTSCIEGWRTPMGMYYIVCGAPDNVDCEGEWDERWNYYQSSTQASMTVEFRLAAETLNIEDRFYRIQQVFSNADLWDYYVNQWRTPY